MKTIFTSTLFLVTFLSFGQTWQSATGLPASAPGRNHPITFSIGDTGYVLTGYGASGGSEMQDFYKYDSKTRTWTKATDFPGRRRGFGYGVSSNGKGYAGFGLSLGTALKDLWEYDPSTGAWKELASCPGTPRWHPAMVAVDSKILMGLGGTSAGDLQDWYEYDIPSNTWSKKANLPASKRHHPYYFGIGSDVYVGLGHSGPDIFKDFYKYEYKTEKWTKVADLPAQGRVAGTQFTYNGKGYVLSGQGEDHRNLGTGEFWEYDPISNSWKGLTAHPGTGRWAPGTFVIGNTVHFFAGRSTIEEKDMWTYSFPVASSLEDDLSGSDLSIYPNPTSGSINLNLGNHQDELEVKVYNALGRMVYNELMQLEGSTTSINLRSLEAGVYIISVEGQRGAILSRRIIKE